MTDLVTDPPTADCKHHVQLIIKKNPNHAYLYMTFDTLTRFDSIKFTDEVSFNLIATKLHIAKDHTAPFSAREKGMLQPCRRAELVMQVFESELPTPTLQESESEPPTIQTNIPSQPQDPIMAQLEQLQAHNAYLKGFIIKLMNHTIKSRFDVLESLATKTKNDDRLKEQRSNHRHRNRIIEVILPKLEAKEATATKNITLDQYLDKFIGSEF